MADYYAASAAEIAKASHCHLLSNRYSVKNNGDLSSTITALAQPGARVSLLLLPGANYYLESDVEEKNRRAAFTLCGLSGGKRPTVHFNSRGKVEGDCLKIDAHKIDFETTGLRAQGVNLVFGYPQLANGLTHSTNRHFCSGKDQCELDFGLFIQSSKVIVEQMASDDYAAIYFVDGGNDSDNWLNQFEDLEIEHNAGKGAVIAQEKGDVKYLRINSRIQGGGTWLRRVCIDCEGFHFNQAFYMIGITGTGIEKGGEAPIWMDLQVQSFSLLGDVCLKGDWEEGIRMNEYEQFSPDGFTRFTNDVCRFTDGTRLYWITDSSDPPYNETRLGLGICGQNIAYQHASGCSFTPFKLPAEIEQVPEGNQEVDSESGSGSGDEVSSALSSLVSLTVCPFTISSSIGIEPTSTVSSGTIAEVTPSIKSSTLAETALIMSSRYSPPASRYSTSSVLTGSVPMVTKTVSLMGSESITMVLPTTIPVETSEPGSDDFISRAQFLTIVVPTAVVGTVFVIVVTAAVTVAIVCGCYIFGSSKTATTTAP